jgi:hypothetical protein
VDHRKYRELWASTLRGHLLPPISFFQKPLHTVIEDKGSTPRGPAIDVFFNFNGGCCQGFWQHLPGGPAIDVFFNFSGDCCRRYRQHLPGGPLSTSSSTSVVATANQTTDPGNHHATGLVASLH